MNTPNYLPNGDSDRVTWMANFDTKLPGYATILGLTTTELQTVSDDRASFAFCVNLVDSYKQTMQNMVAFKDQLKHQQKNTGPLGLMPGLPVIGTPPPAVMSGVFDRVSNLVGRIKKSSNYTESIGQDLNIISPVVTFDATAMQPGLKITLDAGRPHIKWTKGYSDAMDLSVDRGDGAGYVIAGRFITPDYIDTYNLPVNVALAEWHYKGIYVIGNNITGLNSLAVSIVVKRV